MQYSAAVVAERCYTLTMMRRLFNPIKVKYKISFGFDDRYPRKPFYIFRGLAGLQHNAWDMAVRTGTPVHAPERMQVHDVVTGGWRSLFGYGRFVRAISLEDKETEYLFAHLDVVAFPRKGKIWQANELFAWTGNTGWSTGPHLHFSMKRRGRWIDPAVVDWIR